MSRARPALLAPALGLSVLLSSATFLVAKEALSGFPPLTLALFRFVLATLALWPAVRLLRRERIERRDWPRVLLLGLLAVPLNQALFLYGMQWASVSHAALLFALTPAFVVLADLVRGAGRPTPREVIGIALAFAGVLTLLLQRGLHVERRSLVGDLIVLAAVVAWSLYFVVGKPITRKYGPLLVTAEALAVGTVMYLPLGLVALRGFDPHGIAPGAWLGLFYLAWLTSALNYVIWFWGLQHLRLSVVALLTNLQPIVAAFLAWMLMHERLPAGFALSSALVLAGVWLAQSGAGAAAVGEEHAIASSAGASARG